MRSSIKKLPQEKNIDIDSWIVSHQTPAAPKIVIENEN